jgi:hypothetical protein
MADFGSPVAQNVNPGNGLQTLSGLLDLSSKRLGIQQQQQALQTGQATQASAQAKATVDTQNAKENQALAQLMNDPVAGGLIDADGNPTADGEARVLKAAPTTGADAYGKLVTAARLRTESLTAINNLNAQERTEVASTIAGAAAGARSPDDIETAVKSLVAAKSGTGLAADYQKIGDGAMYVIRRGGHPLADPKAVDLAGAKAPLGEEPWRQAALNVGRMVLGPQAVVGAGGIATGTPASVNTGAVQSQGVTRPALFGGGFTPATQVTNQAPPSNTTNAAGQIVNIPGGGGAVRTLPGQNPTAATAAGNQTRAVGTGNADVDTANGVVSAARDARSNIDLTRRIDQLAEIVNPGAVPAKVTQALGALGLQDVNQARTELQKDLGRLRGNVSGRAGSDARAASVLEGYPTDTSPTQTIHQGMDVTRGLARQDLALEALREKSATATGGNMNGFQGDYAHAVSAASPLMHEYLSLSPEDRVGFFQRNFKTKEQAKAFRDQAESVKKLSPDVIGQ